MTEGSRTQRRVIVVVSWLGAAAVATGVALAAVSSIGTGIFGSSAGPLDQEQVAAALVTATSSPEPTGAPSAVPEATQTPQSEQTRPSAEETRSAAEPTVITSAGGTVVAQCRADGRVEVLSWSPNQGFRVDDGEHGPAGELEIEFESGEREVEVGVTCVDGEPDAAIETDD